jgi:hypothetical protein
MKNSIPMKISEQIKMFVLIIITGLISHFLWIYGFYLFSVIIGCLTAFLSLAAFLYYVGEI